MRSEHGSEFTPGLREPCAAPDVKTVHFQQVMLPRPALRPWEPPMVPPAIVLYPRPPIALPGAAMSLPPRGFQQAGRQQKRRWDDQEEERPQVKRRLPGADRQSQDEWASVSAALWAHYEVYQHTEELLKRKLELRERLHGKLRTLFPLCGLYIVGSSLTGFGSNTSDADMCLVLTKDQVDQRQQATAVLGHVARLLARTGWCVGGRPLVIHAKVPILRFCDRTTGVEVDMNVNNVVGLRNTRLLQCYARLDPRAAPLVLAAKAWAAGHQINEAKHGTLSSYSLALMVIQYLQCGCEPAVLPSLQKMQPSKFRSDGDVRLLRLGEDLPPWRSANTQSLGALFVGFVDYFANRFGFSRSCASVRLGAPISRTEVVGASGTARSQWKYVCVEEPFDRSNTARAVYNWDTYQQIVRAFHSTLQDLQSSHSPECLLLPRVTTAAQHVS
ncbi:poly(A) RNA polymerase GLD2-like isoform X1 [Dermacentor andersoni]|uniref:poly(A) RNA polymerase GLD2-like isoform X1 n=1 Tax=Dermacentor andersoni TaxID=34620 RepID=UPI003B3BD744